MLCCRTWSVVKERNTQPRRSASDRSACIARSSGPGTSGSAVEVPGRAPAEMDASAGGSSLSAAGHRASAQPCGCAAHLQKGRAESVSG
jgi:hypothetical protein